MPPTKKAAPAQRAGKAAGDDEDQPSLDDRVQAAIASLRSLATPATLEGMARYGLPRERAFGVSMANMKALAKKLGRDHDLSEALWRTGFYEARMLAALVGEPACVTPEQMDRWCGDFDNWGIADTVCFTLFDRTPHAWGKVDEWAGRADEFVKRAAFALLASLVAHDKRSGDEPFARGLLLIEREAVDGRNFVKKAVNWALRCIGKRNPALNAQAIAVSRRLAESPDPAPRWVGRDALRELTSVAVLSRLEARRPPRAREIQ